MTLTTRALDPFSEVVDQNKRWTPEWYSFVARVHRVGKVIDLPVDIILPGGEKVGTVIAGERAFVTDAAAAIFGNVVVGGGANGVPVYYDGTNWRVG